MNTLAQEFAEFYAKAYPEGAGQEQKRQIQNAFVAGSATAIVNILTAANTQPDDVASKYLEDLLIEAKQHCLGALAKTTETPQ